MGTGSTAKGRHDMLRSLTVEEMQFFAIPRVIWGKTQGCYREFGWKEVMRRFLRESYRPLSRMLRSDGVADISLVSEHLGIGAAPKSQEALRYVKKLGFRHLIDLRAERRKSDILAKTDEISVYWVPTYDDWRPKTTEFFTALESAIKDIMSSEDGEKMVLCCAAGEHRAPLAGLFALAVMGYSLNAAAAMIQKARPVAELLPPYQDSLAAFLETNAARCDSRHVS